MPPVRADLSSLVFDPELLSILLDTPGPDTACLVAANPAIDDAIVRRLVYYSYPVRVELARNPAVSREMLDALSKDAALRAYLAQNTGHPDLLRTVYLLGRDDEVLFWLASNPATPFEVLEWIAEDTKVHRRVMLAHQVRGPHRSSVLDILRRDRHPKVRAETRRAAAAV
ncbi:hypothetical protein [Agromyces humi]|uniref:hypothetical protein n=1 Tax=Agromyces humi TaxID=1766800 RepID=UPI00135A1F1C|nr:hypothetical protein [Agromyces humi]